VSQIVEIRIAGGSRSDICRFASEIDKESGRPWRVSDRQIERYISMADDILARRQERDRNKRVALGNARLEALYARCFESGDWRTCLAIQKYADERNGDGQQSLSALADELEEVKQQIMEQRNVETKITPRAGQGEGNGPHRNGHSGKQSAETKGMASIASD
jgi:hypothetical protein